MSHNRYFTDRECFKAFSRKVKELRGEELLKQPFTSKMRISGSIEKREIQITWNKPNKSLLQSSWITMRYFFLKKECGYIFRIYNLAQKYLINEQHKEWLLKSKKQLKSEMKSSGINLVINGKKCSSEIAFDTYINAHFHNDQKCIGFLDSLNEGQRAFFETEMVGFIFRAADHINYLARVIEYAIKNKEIKPLQN